MPNAPYFSKVVLSSIQKAYKFANYPYYTQGDYNVNIGAIRTNEQIENTFNDVLFVTYKVKNIWQLFVAPVTANDAGVVYRTNPMNPAGTAILRPGYYKGLYEIGLHNGKYQALVQKGKAYYWRDNNKNKILDHTGPVVFENARTNIHRSVKSGTATNVGAFSAGCTVFANFDDFTRFMNIIKKSRDIFGNSFSYALFDESTFFCKRHHDYDKVYPFRP